MRGGKLFFMAASVSLIVSVICGCKNNEGEEFLKQMFDIRLLE